MKPSVIPFVLTASVILTATIFLSCSKSPGTITGNDPPGQSGEGDIDPNGAKDFFLASADVDGVEAGRVDVWGHNLRVESASTVAFDVVLINRSNQSIHPPLLFLIEEISPPHVQVINPDFIGREGPVGFDFSDDLGDDGVLAPGESTNPVTMRFEWREPTSFSIAFAIQGHPLSEDKGTISGIVFQDLNANGEYDGDEPGLPGFVVELKSDGATLTGLHRMLTDERGHYAFHNLEASVNTVSASSPDMMMNWVPTTTNPLLITLIEIDHAVGDVSDAHFGFRMENVDGPVTVFGPLPVGPGAFIGSDVKMTFRVFANGDRQFYFLKVKGASADNDPPRISTSEIRINDELVYESDCKRNEEDCVPEVRRSIASGLIQPGANVIEITVTGAPNSFIAVSVERE